MKTKKIAALLCSVCSSDEFTAEFPPWIQDDCQLSEQLEAYYREARDLRRQCDGLIEIMPRLREKYIMQFNAQLMGMARRVKVLIEEDEA